MSLPKRVMVIDDDPLFRRLVVALLETGFQVTAASDGAEGFHLALQDPPDLVLVDILMPGWDGLQTLRAFRGHPRLMNVPVVILTSDTSRETVVAAARSGVSDYVVKSNFSRQELISKLCLLLGCEEFEVRTPSRGRQSAGSDTVSEKPEKVRTGAETTQTARPSPTAGPSRTAQEIRPGELPQSQAVSSEPAEEDVARLMDDWD